IDPVRVERFLQRRTGLVEGGQKINNPRDKTLGEAVTRMTAVAKAEGKERLVRSQGEWKTLVWACMKSNDLNRFTRDVVKRVGEVPSLDNMNKWLALAMNIWNSTPQPDRGGRTAYEMLDNERNRTSGHSS
ncbi:unnamed protein product, partial [marine sediment metagenome]